MSKITSDKAVTCLKIQPQVMLDEEIDLNGTSAFFKIFKIESFFK